MPQFMLHRNKNPDTKARIPYLIDVQSNLLGDLGTRVVIPVCSSGALKGKVLTTLTPTFELDDGTYVMLTPQLAGISKKELGQEVANLSAYRAAIIAALDFLITGI
ncbi:MAG: CcdB family protein [Pseudomonadota bacterium]|nr:CcdB family protein [Pseudomonadota bacterium]